MNVVDRKRENKVNGLLLYVPIEMEQLCLAPEGSLLIRQQSLGAWSTDWS